MSYSIIVPIRMLLKIKTNIICFLKNSKTHSFQFFVVVIDNFLNICLTLIIPKLPKSILYIYVQYSNRIKVIRNDSLRSTFKKEQLLMITKGFKFCLKVCSTWNMKYL